MIFDQFPKEILLTEIHAEVRKIYEQRRRAAEAGENNLASTLGSSTISMAKAAEQTGYLGPVRVVYDTTERMFETLP
jgi:hypothetical protein